MASKLTKAQRIAAYQKILVANKHKVKAGYSMTRKQFTRLFKLVGITHKGSFDDVHRSNMLLVQAQNEINSLLATSGMYMSSRGYYGEFYIRDQAETKNVVERMSGRVDTYDASTQRLLGNMESRVRAGTWGKYNKTNKNQAAVAVDDTRHTNVKARLKLV